MVRARLFLAALLFSACHERPKAPRDAGAPQTTTAGLPDLEDPESCRPCHQNVLEEWSESAHAQAATDPIFLGVKKLRAKREADLERKCAACHSPRSKGVTCFACHGPMSIDLRRGRGARAMTFSKDRTLYGPLASDLSEGLVHKSARAPHIEDGRTLCFACHSDLSNPSGVPLCQTVTEWRGARTDRTCVDCHMGQSDGPSGAASSRKVHTSHLFGGPRRLWSQTSTAIAARGMVEIDGSLSGRTLELSLKNKTGHAFPSGFPGRQATVEVSSGIWRHVFVLGKKHVDAQGKPTIAAYAAKIASDTRLLPMEQRAVQIRVPQRTKQVRVRLTLRLLPLALAGKIGLEGALTEPRVVASAIIRARQRLKIRQP